MKRLLVLGGLLVQLSCQSSGREVCELYCDQVVSCGIDLYFDGCDADEVAAECREACVDEWREESTDQADVEECVRCLAEDLEGECDGDLYPEAFAECRSSCDDDDAMEFFRDLDEMWVDEFACLGPIVGSEVCTNLEDDDQDGYADCADPDCAALCGEVCTNGADDDLDGLIDCLDDDCDGLCPESCGDGRDNDGDGAIDCDDRDCFGSCPEVCGDGFDNDGDGRVDCDDSDCEDVCP